MKYYTHIDVKLQLYNKFGYGNLYSHIKHLFYVPITTRIKYKEKRECIT